MLHVSSFPRFISGPCSGALVAALLLGLQLAACKEEGSSSSVDALNGVAGGASPSAGSSGASVAPRDGLAAENGEGLPIAAMVSPGAGGSGASRAVREVDNALDASVAARVDAATPAMVAGAACPVTAQLCEDFEDQNLDGWRSLPSGGTLRIDSGRAFGGTAALSIEIPANQRGGFIERTGAPLFPLPNGMLWGRVMVFFESAPDGHSDIVRGAPAGGGTPWYNVGEQHGEILLNYYNGAARDCWARPRPGRPVALAKWTCWEWNFDTENNRMDFWIDGQLSREVDGVGDGCVTGGNQVWTAPEIGSLRIGEYIAQPSAIPTRLWLDDVAVSTEARVGCPATP